MKDSIKNAFFKYNKGLLAKKEKIRIKQEGEYRSNLFKLVGFL